MPDPIDEAAARALPCLWNATECRPGSGACGRCLARPAVAAEMRALVERAVAEEREACARMAQRQYDENVGLGGHSQTIALVMRELATAIRARGEKETT